MRAAAVTGDDAEGVGGDHRETSTVSDGETSSAVFRGEVGTRVGRAEASMDIVRRPAIKQSALKLQSQERGL